MKPLTNLFLMIALCLVGTVLPAHAVVRVVTSTTDFADIVRQIGGTRVQVQSLATGSQDLHRIEPRPSFVSQLSRADVVVRIGMDLDLWMDSLIDAARNEKVRAGGAGYLDASAGIKPIEVPSGKIDGSKGDIHIYGNPHYWLDPLNGKIIARNILVVLTRVDPKGATTYQQNYDRFVKELDHRMAEWQQRMAPLKGAQVVTYHTTWNYFLRRFGLELAGTMESKPGIPPSASHVGALMHTMKAADVKVVMTTTYYPNRFTNLIHRETGIPVLVLPSSVDPRAGAENYFALFDTTIAQLAAVK